LVNLILALLSEIFLILNGDWGLGIGDWGLGIGPNPQSPIPNPQFLIKEVMNNYLKIILNK